MRAAIAIGFVAILAAPAVAKPKDDEEDTSADDSSSSDDAPADDDEKPKKKKPPKDEAPGDDETTQQDKDFKKQDLSGHDLGTEKKENEFERDRFFVDKVDSKKTKDATLVQGSIASSSFYYGERGGTYAMPGVGDNSAQFSRMFSELRLQTDFRHIGGGKWDARVDARIRLVSNPADTDFTNAIMPQTDRTTPTRIQSGFNGMNEYDLRELWLVRNGERSDVFLGRQYITDLGAIKIDGVRVDYASSNKFTILGFAGAFPERGSRSITTDYPDLRDNQLDPAGKLVGALGGGAAYRTVNAYGAIGGVAEIPFQAEKPRIYATSNGYWRYGSAIDFYHYAILDLVNQNYGNGTILTNLSLGLNYKPSPRLRMTVSFNRVDTETLNVQANAYLNPADGNLNVVQNEAYIQRLSTNNARASVSAGLGQLQRFELTAAATYRYRPDITLTPPAAPDGTAGTPVQLDAESGVDLYASITDRHSIKDARISFDISRTIGLGSVAYARSEVLAARFAAAHEFHDGEGEWEAELSYANTTDKSKGITCADLTQCYGASTGTIISIGGNIYFRINRNWFLMGSAFLSRQSLTSSGTGTAVEDPAITGLTGFFRIAYRF